MCSCNVVSQSGNFFNVNCQGPKGNRFYNIQASSQHEALVIARQKCTDEVSISGEADSNERLTDEEIKALSIYAEDIRNLTEDYRPFYFNCILTKADRCGDYGFGSIDYLLNSASDRRFRVTVRTSWNGGQNDKVFIVEAGSRVQVGCDQVPGSRPTIFLTRQIVGEVQL